METINLPVPAKSIPGRALWTGRIITFICVTFLLVDSIMKLVMHPMYVDGTQQLGWSLAAVKPIGLVLLGCTLLYIIPRTAIAGAILLTAYFGGAVATMARLGEPFYFPIMFSALTWLGLYLLNGKLRSIVALLLK